LVRVRNARSRVVLLVGAAIARDAVHEPPKPPIKAGVLRGSVNVDPIRNGARVSFRTAYAARWHEASESVAANWPSKSIDPDVGPKFLESKIIRFRDKYREYAARAMERRV